MGVSSAGVDPAFDRDECCRIIACVLRTPADEVFRMLDDPWVIRRDMVRHKIQNPPHPAPGELSARSRQRFRATKVGVDSVTPHGIGRPHVVLRTEIGEFAPEIVQKNLVSIGDRDTGWAAFPDAHQPYSFKAEPSDGVPFGRWNGAQVDRTPDLRADGGEPDPRVDLIDRRMRWPARHDNPCLLADDRQTAGSLFYIWCASPIARRYLHFHATRMDDHAIPAMTALSGLHPHRAILQLCHG